MKTSHVWRIDSAGYPLGVYVLAAGAEEALRVFYAYDTERRWKSEGSPSEPTVVYGCARVLSGVIVPEAAA